MLARGVLFRSALGVQCSLSLHRFQFFIGGFLQRFHVFYLFSIHVTQIFSGTMEAGASAFALMLKKRKTRWNPLVLSLQFLTVSSLMLSAACEFFTACHS
jgi:hypothetical protein